MCKYLVAFKTSDIWVDSCYVDMPGDYSLKGDNNLDQLRETILRQYKPSVYLLGSDKWGRGDVVERKEPVKDIYGIRVLSVTEIG